MSKKKDEIILSPKHGVNPTMPICFFCGEEKGQIALMGRINKADDEAPRHMLLDYEPCDKCKEKMSKGLTLIGVTEEPKLKNQFPIAEGLYPTGNWVVITEECARRVFTEEACEKILQHRKGLTDDEIVKQMAEQSGEPLG